MGVVGYLQGNCLILDSRFPVNFYYLWFHNIKVPFFVRAQNDPHFRMSSWYSLVPRPPPSFLSLAVRKSWREPGTFRHVSDVTDRANYTNMGDM